MAAHSVSQCGSPQSLRLSKRYSINRCLRTGTVGRIECILRTAPGLRGGWGGSMRGPRWRCVAPHRGRGCSSRGGTQRRGLVLSLLREDPPPVVVVVFKGRRPINCRYEPRRQLKGGGELAQRACATAGTGRRVRPVHRS
eukprot:scaffold45828_cov29-Tisochrysis_lutea.AAC.1